MVRLVELCFEPVEPGLSLRLLISGLECWLVLEEQVVGKNLLAQDVFNFLEEACLVETV